MWHILVTAYSCIAVCIFSHFISCEYCANPCFAITPIRNRPITSGLISTVSTSYTAVISCVSFFLLLALFSVLLESVLTLYYHRGVIQNYEVWKNVNVFPLDLYLVITDVRVITNVITTTIIIVIININVTITISLSSFLL
jgi:hypothetical protein